MKGALLITSGEKSPYVYNKAQKRAPQCEGTYLGAILPLCVSLGRHRLSGSTHGAAPAREQLLTPGHVNIQSFDVVLKQFFVQGEPVGRAWAAASTAALRG